MLTVSTWFFAFAPLLSDVYRNSNWIDHFLDQEKEKMPVSDPNSTEGDMFLILIIYLYIVHSFPPFVNNN
jgi:hypothetical protein